ncbi:MAG: hypothetical protein ABIQ15_07395, partial [Nocardioides sp.]
MTAPRRPSTRLVSTLLVVVLGAASAVTGTLASGAAATAADDTTGPSAQDVAQAKAAAAARARTVAAVRTDLVLADQRLRTSSISAAQAAEAFNTARWQLSLARNASRVADQAQQIATEAVERQRAAYESTLTSAYQMSPELTALSAIVRSDGISTVVDRATTLGNAEQALDQQYDDFRAAATVAEVTADQATEARTAAEELRTQTRAARDEAAAAEQDAADEAAAVAGQRSSLIGELAALQGVSVDLAGRRQAALERRAEERRRRQEEKRRRREADAPTPTPPPTP